MGDEPPYLSVGTEVSAKYKGAFCEAKIRKVVRSVKCKVIFKQGLGPTTVADDQIKGVIRNGGTVEVKLPDKKELLEATITKIQDCSQYTVVFDDGDITTLRRTALCLKSGRHFAEGETLDQLPLTHPEHFSNPVIGGRRGRRARVGIEESSEDEEAFFLRYKDFMEDKEEDIGRVVCVEGAEKKKQKDNWFPGLVVAPTAQDTVTIDTRLEYLVRSFKDGRYYTVPKKEALEFTREIGSKAEGSILKAAVEKALQFLDKDDLPPHWDRDSLFGLNEMQGTDSEAGYDCESSDDEPTELKDHFVAQLYKFMDDSGTPINKGPTIGSQDVDLYKLYKIVNNQGGFNRVTNQNNWKLVSAKLGFGNNPTSISAVKQVHKKFLYSFEDFNRKLGCTLVPHPRTSRSRSRSTRTLIRDRDKAIKQEPKSDSKENSSFSTKEDSPSIGISSALPVRIKIEPGLESPEQEDTLLGINTNSRKSQEVNSGEEIKIKQEPFDMKEEISEVKKTRQKKARTRLIDQVIGGKNEANKSTNPVNKEKKRRLFPRGKKEKNIIQTVKKTTLPIRARHKTALYSNNLKSFGEYLKLTRASKMLNSAFGIQDNIDKASHTSRNKVKEDQVLPKVKKEESVAAVSPIEDKKRTRRRKEKAEIIHEGIVPLPCYKTINVGDKLTVYYGPKHDPKVTYEAKVLDIRREGSDTMYLVHYFGWNNRYDEWIKHSRIADNLSSGRSTKRSLQVSRGGRKRNTPVKTGNDSNFKSNTDSTAYASNQVTDTKTDNNLISPQAINKIKGTRANTRSSIRRVASVSETEEYESDSMSVESTAFSKRKVLVAQERLGTVNVPTNDRRGRKRKSIESEGKDKFDCDCGLKKTPMQTKRAYKTRETTRRRNDVKNAKDEDANTSTRSENSSSEANIGSVEILSKFEGFDGYSDDDYALYIDSDSDQEGDETIKTETITDEETEKLLQKGRDFDLNEIRSELKGIESAVGSNASIKIDQGFGEDGSLAEDKEINEEHIKEDQNNANNINATLHNPVKQEIEDVYEFKEPEPFEFESRKMDDKNKLQRRTLSRCYLDESRLSPQRKKLKPSSPTFSSKSTHISETINLTASKETLPTDISAISVPRTYPKYNKFMQASSSIFAPLFEHADDSIDLSKVKIKRDRVRGSWGNLDVSYIKGDKTRELIKITITPDTNSKGDPGTPDSFTSGSSSDEPLSPTIDEMYEPDKYPSKTIAKYKAYRERLLKEFSSPDKESSAIPPVNESETPTVNEETPTLSFKESPISSLNEPAVLPLNQPVSSINNKANVSSLNDGSSSLNKTITALNKVTNLINKPPSLTVNDSFTSSLNRMTASLTNTAVMPLSKMPPMLYNATSSLSSTSPASLLNNASNLLNVPPASLLNEPSLTSSTNNSTLLSTVTNTEYSPCKVPAQSSDQLYSSSVKSPNPAAETEDASFNGMKSNCTLERKEMDPNFTLSTYEDVDSKDFTIEILDKDESSPKSEMKENINIDHEMEQLERRFEEECELVKDKNRDLEVDESKVTEEVEGLDDISVLEEIEDTADVDESSEVVVSEVGEVGEVDDTHEEEEGTEEYEAADDDLTDIEETADVVEETGEIVETTEVEMGDIVETGELLEKQIEPADDIEAGNSEETTEATESEEPMEEDETEVVEINAMEEKETEVAEVEVEDEDDEEMEEVVKPEIYNIEFSEEKSTTDEFMDIGNTTSATKDDDDPDEEDNEVDDEQEDEDDPKDEGDDEEDDVEEDCVRAVMKEEETEKKDKMNGKNKSVVKDEDDEDDEEENLISLLCNEEIIPRSPNPQADEAQEEEEEEDKNILVVTEIDNDEGLPLSEKLDNDFHREKDVKEAAVEENSPPPSPDSSTSSVSSPIQERPVEPVGTKHNSEYEVDSAPQKNGSEDTQRLRIDARLKKIEGRVSMKKGRRSRKQSQDLGRKKYSRSIRNHASDSDEFYDTPRISSPREIVHRLSRNGKYNFLVKIDSQNSPDYNIALLMQALHNLRNCYQEVKSELTVIDRKRKRFRRRERENGQPTNRYHYGNTGLRDRYHS